MAIAITSAVAAVASTSNASSYAMGAFTPTANALLVVYVFATGTATTPSTMSGGGLTWTQRGSLVYASTSRAYCFTAQVGGSPASTTITWDCTGDAATGCVMIAFSVTGHNQQYPLAQFVSNTAASTNATVTRAAANTNNGYTAAWGGALGSNVSTPPTSWTENGDTSYTTPAGNASGAYRAGGETSTTVTFTNATTTWACLYFEVNAAGIGNPTGTGTGAEQPFAGSGVAEEVFSGTGAGAEQPFAGSASGAEEFTGTGTGEEQPFASSATGSQADVGATGTATGAETPFASSSAGTETIGGAGGGGAEQPFGSSAAGTETLGAGVGSGVEQPFANTGAAALVFPATGTGAEQSFANSAAGAESFPATGTGANRSFASSSAGTETIGGAGGGGAEQPFGSSSAGAEVFSGTASGVEQSFASSSSGSESFPATGTGANRSFAAAGTGVFGDAVSGAAAGAEQPFASAATGSESIPGSASSSMSSFGSVSAGVITIGGGVGIFSLQSFGLAGVGSQAGGAPESVIVYSPYLIASVSAEWPAGGETKAETDG